ncbi:Alpha/Beta hydrolase protein [Butyriboletus roseoflavus]|nr:Alpha/Beta hydrolase protein [Butyriboletus roseoflavus]
MSPSYYRIGLFGGDDGHVTIWGESAGAGSVLQHIVANGGNTQPPLFNAAITSSTFLPSQYYYNDRVPQLVYDEIAAMTGCTSNADTFTCLQSVKAETLQTVNYDVAGSGFYGTFVFVPVVDDTFILERPTVTLAKGRHLVCPTYYLLQAFAGRSWKVSPVCTRIAVELTELSQGLFAIPPAYHVQDVAYYFASPSSLPPYNNTQFITAFSQPFMSLVKYYDVNIIFDPTNITPDWNEYYIEETEMLFNRTEAGEPAVVPIQTDPKLLERCAFWATATATTAQ